LIHIPAVTSIRSTEPAQARVELAGIYFILQQNDRHSLLALTAKKIVNPRKYSNVNLDDL